MPAKNTLNQMESKLYFSDRWAWAIYTALRVAPGPKEKATLWGLLSPDQQDALRIMARHKDTGTQPTREAPELPLHKGPTHDKYGVKL